MMFASKLLLLTSLVFLEGGVNESNVTDGSTFEDANFRLFIGGSRVANIREAPFVVALVLSKHSEERSSLNGYFRAFCTGAIILARWVLTCAHCVEFYFTVRFPFQVYAGCQSQYEFDPIIPVEGRQIRDPIRVLRHPYYSESNWAAIEKTTYDVGLVKVDEFHFGVTVKPIQLWSKEWEGVQGSGDYFSTECTVYGWGLEQRRNKSENLRTGVFTVKHGASGCACPFGSPSYAALSSYEYNRNSICTEPLSGKSLCSGDSGGPLVCKGILAGVTKGVKVCYPKDGPIGPAEETCGSSKLISEWTYVCPMLQWIHWKIPELPDLPTSCRSPPSVTASLTPALLLVYSIFC